MTEKVVSLSGGLVLGMAFALLLGVTASQNGSSSMNVDYPSISSLIGNNDFQSYRTSSPAPQASDTTPVINVSPPPPRENTGRIVRIATASETTHPVTASPVTTATEEIALKGHETIETPKDTDNLRQINLQNTYTARLRKHPTMRPRASLPARAVTSQPSPTEAPRAARAAAQAASRQWLTTSPR